VVTSRSAPRSLRHREEEIMMDETRKGRSKEITTAAAEEVEAVVVDEEAGLPTTAAEARTEAILPLAQPLRTIQPRP